MRTRKTERGGGILNRLKAAFTRKKAVPRAAPQAAPQVPLRQPLSWGNQRRLKELQAQRSNSKEQTEEQTRLEQRAAYEASIAQARVLPDGEASVPRRRFLNRFRTQKDVPTPTQVLKMPIEGILDVYSNSRKSFDRQRARIPNSQLPTPPTLLPNEVRSLNGEPIQLASQLAVEVTNIPRLYAMFKGEDPKESLEEIPEEEFDAFAARIRAFRGTGAELEEMTQELFGKSEEEMNEWVTENEQGKGYDRGEYKTMEYRVTMPDGTRRPVKMIKVLGAGSIGRYFARISAGKRAILLAKENNDHICVRDADDNTRDSYTPLTTLKSNGCFTLGNGEKFHEIGLDANERGTPLPDGSPKSYPPGMLKKNWMVVAPEYFPIPSAAFLPLQAKYFGSATYIQDALTAWAVQGIDPLFLQLLQLKYPQYAIKFTSYFLNTKDYSYQSEKLKASLTFAYNYAVIDKELFPQEVGFTALNPFTPPSAYATLLDSAARQKKLYGVTPYLAYAMKAQVPTLWNIAFDSPVQDASLEVYAKLTAQEKITLDYLQFLLWRDRLLGTNLSFPDARLTYTMSLQDAGLRKKMVDLYMLNPMESRRELAFYQKVVTKEYKGDRVVELVRKAEIESLLAKIGTKIQQSVSPAPLAVSGLFANLEVEEEPPVQEAPPPRELPAPSTLQPRRVSWSGNAPSSARPNPVKAVVHPRGAFVEAQETSQEAERAKLRHRKGELLAYLQSLQADYDRLKPRIANVEGRSRFLQTKKRYGKLSTVELRNLRNAAVLQEFPSLKQRAEQEVQRIQGLLDRLGS
jgi:hypothetical protein